MIKTNNIIIISIKLILIPRSNILDMKKKGEALQIPYEEQLKILEKNNGKLPDNFNEISLPEIHRRQGEILRGVSNSKNILISGNELDKLPSIKDANPKKGYYNPASGKTVVVRDGKWVEYKGD